MTPCPASSGACDDVISGELSNPIDSEAKCSIEIPPPLCARGSGGGRGVISATLSTYACLSTYVAATQLWVVVVGVEDAS